MTPPPTHTAVIVSDAHLGPAVPDAERDFIHFLDRVPDLGDHLVINGDLFDFWFEYRAVIPRTAFPTLAALARVRQRGVALTLTGGNHDRWGGSFFERELDARFHPDGTECALAGWRVWLAHGDGLAEQHAAGRFMHWITRRGLTVRLFRWIHPDLGIRLADRMSGTLAERTRDAAALDRAAAAQAELARRTLAARPDLDLAILGHTHRAALESVAPRRWYLNPGAWLEERRYALLTAEGPALRRYT